MASNDTGAGVKANVDAHWSTTIMADAESLPDTAQTRVRPTFLDWTTPCGVTAAMLGSEMRYAIGALGTARRRASTTRAATETFASSAVRR